VSRQPELLKRFRRLRVVVLGEAMLDSYLEGAADRLCSEGPVPVVRRTTEQHSPGGAANTAANAAALGAQVAFIGITGTDEPAHRLRAELRRRAAGGAECHVVAPILTSRSHYIASDVDKELDEARERLATALAWAKAEGIPATGKVGDPNAALGAIEDELRLFGADEIIISTYPPGKSNWLETGIVERLRAELDIPVTHVVIHPDRASVPAT
jgi:hypothetical protein